MQLHHSIMWLSLQHFTFTQQMSTYIANTTVAKLLLLPLYLVCCSESVAVIPFCNDSLRHRILNVAKNVILQNAGLSFDECNKV